MDNIEMRITPTATTKVAALGRVIRIGKKALATVSAPGASYKFEVPSVGLTIGIGKDHMAFLLMTEEAWEELKSANISEEDISITSIQDYIKQISGKK